MYRIRVRTPVHARAAVEEMLLGITDFTSTEIIDNEVEIAGFSRSPPDTSDLIAAFQDLGIRSRVSEPEEVADDDWVARGLRRLPAVRSGRFVLRGSHLPAAERRFDDICIDAGEAFGTGHHPTTATAIELLSCLARGRLRPHALLDMGTGAGTLAIVMARLWKCPVTAVDNDPVAVRCATENAVRNRVAHQIRVVEADGYRSVQGPFDIVAANLYAAPLRTMVPELLRCLGRRGQAVLSGLLDHQRMPILRAHAAAGMVPRRIIRRDGWVTLHLARAPTRTCHRPSRPRSRRHRAPEAGTVLPLQTPAPRGD